MGQRLLVCTDLDRTLMPNGYEMESPLARPLFRRLAARPEVALAYVTGRDKGRVMEAIEEYELPLPLKVIADVGSTIYDIHPDGDWQVNHGWFDEIGKDWDRYEGPTIRDMLGAFEGMRAQDDTRQGRYKLSFYVSLDVDTESLCQAVRAKLRESAIAASVIYSVDEPGNIGLLDILPKRATKLHAVQFVMQTLNFTLADTVFSGDSGNDLDILASEVPGILVGNASPDVVSAVLDQAAEAGTQNSLYLARGGFFGMNSYYAAGIVEGVAHFHPDVLEWLGDEAELEALV